MNNFPFPINKIINIKDKSFLMYDEMINSVLIAQQFFYFVNILDYLFFHFLIKILKLSAQLMKKDKNS